MGEGPGLATWLTVVAAVSSAVAAIASVFATWRSPRSAAMLTDRLRQEGEKAQHQLQRKLDIFDVLMQQRSDLHSSHIAQALNQIDVVFNGSADVREAWHRLFAAQTSTEYPPLVPNQQLTELLLAIARDIGLAGRLGTADVTRVCFPDQMRGKKRRESSYPKAGLQSVDPETFPAQPGSTRPV